MLSLVKTAAETATSQVTTDNGPQSKQAGSADYAAGVAARAPKPAGEQARILRYEPANETGVRMILSKGERAGVIKGMTVALTVAGCRLVGRVQEVFPFRSRVQFGLAEGITGQGDVDFSRRAQRLLSQGRRDVVFLPMNSAGVTAAEKLPKHLQSRSEANKGAGKAAAEAKKEDVTKPDTAPVSPVVEDDAQPEDVAETESGGTNVVMQVHCQSLRRVERLGKRSYMARLVVDTGGDAVIVEVDARSPAALRGEYRRTMRQDGFSDPKALKMAKDAIDNAIKNYYRDNHADTGSR